MNEYERILKKAEKEHNMLKHPYVGTEHLLLAILSLDNDLTEKLKTYNLTYNKFKKRLKEIIGEGSNKSPYILYTPMLRKVLNIAENKSKIITSKVLFLALLEAKEGIAIRIMETMKIDIDSINILSENYMEVDNISITNRDNEINEILQILMRKNKCNPLLIGDAGVGKTAIVEEIQRKLINNDVPDCLKGYKIINVDISQLVAGTKYRGDFESKINDLLTSVEKEKAILFIDEIHTLVHAGGAEGAISAGDIIKPYLARGKIKCIGATTISEYHEYFEVDEALNRRFQTVLIKEPSNIDTINILNGLKKSYEKYHNIKIDNELINEIVLLASKYITNKRNPDKSIELLDSCCANAKFNEKNNVAIDNLYKIFKNRYGIDINNDYIKNILNNKIILITSIDNIYKIYSMPCNVINIDGKRFKSDDDLYNLIGNPLIKKGNYLLKSAIDNPIGIITITNYNYNLILKEFVEKIIKSRRIIDNYGNNISFDNYIIIMEGESEKPKIGFASNYDLSDDFNYLPLDEKILLPST
ncbi:MAG: ATP-dependent Clp protease ATP-binding subunit [Bacilli bacterium]|nr:ATP-dependent Clp protease ATP-binding subunit [Bacilli bacterium]